jgi:hypothetical protein
MPASLPISGFGLTFPEVVDIVQVCQGLRLGEWSPSSFRRTLTARLRISHPLLAFKIDRCDLGQMEQLCSYLKKIL